MTEYSLYCIKGCPIGKPKSEEFLKANNSGIDAAIDMQFFVTSVSWQDAPTKKNALNTTNRKAVTDNGKRKPQSTIQAQERTLEKQTAEAEGKVSVDRRQLDLLSGGGMQTTQRIFDEGLIETHRCRQRKCPGLKPLKKDGDHNG